MNIKRFCKDAPLPVRKTDGAAGYDLPICAQQQRWYNSNEPTGRLIGLNDEYLKVDNEECILIPLGWGIEIPDGYYGKLEPRSSKNHWLLSGVIDSDYRGEMFAKTTTALLQFHKPRFAPFDRIMQLIIHKYEVRDLVEVPELSPTARGSGGNGSTGR
jgi:deoxyuridine 5'-triphosphate nucleotidohydrolase